MINNLFYKLFIFLVIKYYFLSQNIILCVMEYEMLKYFKILKIILFNAQN